MPETGRLFDVESTPARSGRATKQSPPPSGRRVRVLPDVASITKEFDYIVPDRLLTDAVRGWFGVGSMVRIPLHGRQVPGWVTAVDVEASTAVDLKAISKISGIGPSAGMVELCRWVAWRWAAKPATILGAASPPRMVHSLPATRTIDPIATIDDGVHPTIASAYDRSVSLIRLSPAASPVPIATFGAQRGHILVITPTLAAARNVAEGMRRSGVRVALHPDGWARGAAGCSIVGTRTAVFAPVVGLSAVVVIDEHDEALQNEGSPTWNAREIAIERGRRSGVPVVLVSPVPTLEATAAAAAAGGAPLSFGRNVERAGWATIEVVDRREEDVARSGLYSPAVVRALQSGRRVVCVLNRTGRSQMLGCQRCGTLATCEVCEAFVRQDVERELTCPSCGTVRPEVCGHCDSTVFRPIRIGVTKAREQLETLLREPVEEISGSAAVAGRREGRSRVIVGTEAALQRVVRADLVAFLEFDQELAAPRYRASEQAMTLLARASRLVGGRAGHPGGNGGRVLVQTRQPDHEVLRAAMLGSPASLQDHERERRALLELPPIVTTAVVGGVAAPAFIESFRLLTGENSAIVIDQRDEQTWLVRSRDQSTLLDALSAVRRPPGRLQLQVDPARLPG